MKAASKVVALVALGVAALTQFACMETISERNSFDEKYGRLEQTKGAVPSGSGNVVGGTGKTNMPWRGGFRAY